MRIALSCPAVIALVVVVVAAASALAGGCSDKNPYEASAKPVASAPPRIEGVDPDHFDCKAFLSEAEVATATAAGPVTWQPADMPGSPGTPQACVYVSNEQPAAPADAAPHKGPDAGPEPSKGILAWQFHLDCRPVAVGDAQATIATMKTQDGSKELPLGRGAIDHSNARIIAVDDDTDCAAYVVGPDQATREALANAVLKKLTRTNMPRSPRAVR